MSKAAPATAESSAESTEETEGSAVPDAGRGRGAARPAARRNRRRRSSRVPGWWPLPVCVALGALGGGGYATLAEPRYEATSYVLVSPGPHAEAASALGYAQAYGKVATDAFVLGAAEADAGLPRGALRSRVRAAASPDAPMVRITGSAPRPGRAADYADAVARSLTGAAKKSAKRTGVRLTVVAHAAPSAGPVSPSMPIAVAVGTSAGGLLGALVLLARPQRRRAADGAAVPAPAPGGDGTASGARQGTAGRPAAEPEGAR
ncbi:MULTISPECIES: hypothetical protein [Streptomyces]|uniref:Lipopolysaccharide biosynthesis protein n=1 Tax=Streptomyces qinglanensis TaxID=943816 RepID=A0A1E7K619_9ACTN|nr:hypothetical protein [Streptomyces qinglanensis]OEU99380.1 hypothetical protein AN217_17925 [Streptomyces qinglanensis]